MEFLFSPYKIGDLEIKNRFMRSATTSYYSDQLGRIRPEIIELYEKLAQGEIGLIVKGHLYVSDDGKSHSGMAGISNEEHIPGLQKLTEAVHKLDGKIVAQINHAGIDSLVDPAGPSENLGASGMARALRTGEIHSLVGVFGDAAERVMKAGFDGVQLHGAHGYLISQFLSKKANRRSDEYGGSLENRMRFLIEIIEEIRSRTLEFPLMIKMNSDDFSPSGFTIDESVKVAKKISSSLDLIEVSGGGFGRKKELFDRARSSSPQLREAFFAGHAKKIRNEIGQLTLALVGGIRNKNTIEAVIREDIADLISMSRPFIREPDLIKKIKAGQETLECISCDACNPLHGRGTVKGDSLLHCPVKSALILGENR